MKKNSKETIVNAAISLFTTKGYSGTSIRDIANVAKVNPANIAYYFENKHGLLEYCFTTFFEQYIEIIEHSFELLIHGASFCLKQISSNLLNFFCENILLTCFIFREMSIDSQIVREIMSSYFLKEKYYLESVLERGIETNEFRPISISYIIVQLKSLWMMPFLNAPYLREVLFIFPNEPFFIKKYSQEVNHWIDDILCKREPAILYS